MQLGADPTVLDRDGNSTLHLAVMHAEDSLKDLLKSGRFSKSSINVLNDEGSYTSRLSLLSLNSYLLLLLLVPIGPILCTNLSFVPPGFSALHLAAQSNKMSCIRFLVQYGADVDQTVSLLQFLSLNSAFKIPFITIS